MFLWCIFLFAFKQPEVKPCVIDRCEQDVCTIETPEGWVEVARQVGYYEGKRLSVDECPMSSIDPT
jgi:SH3-like domain-containing protein